MPVAFMMGIPYGESFTVAELIGTKLFLNEFVAFEKLSELKDNRLNGLDEVIGGNRQWISVSKCSELSKTSAPKLTRATQKRKRNKSPIQKYNTIFSFQVRSEIITTYALCGFANFSSLGIVIGGLCEFHFTCHVRVS